MKRHSIIFLPLLMSLLLAAGSEPIAAQSTNENVLVFSATGVFLESYHEGDYTPLIDATDITYEEYAPGSPPSVSGGGTQPYTFTAGEHWVPNNLDGMFPAPVGGLPQVSLYSFDDAVLSFDAPGVPGIAASPAAGTYTHTVEVILTAYPLTAVVEIFNDSTNAWETFGNSKSVLIAQTRTLRVRSDDGGTKSPEKMLTYEIDQDPDVDTDGDTIPDVIEILLVRFNPLVSDAGLDTDASGWTDLDELLRGSDPDNTDSDGDGWSDSDENSMGTDRFEPTDFPAGPLPVYSPRLEPLDTDSDLWADLDEGWRSTNPNDIAEFPTARRLYEVEMLADGQFNALPAVQVDESRSFKIVEPNGLTHVSETLGSNAFVGVRSPRGNLSLLRLAIQSSEFVDGATQVNNSWSSRKLLPPLGDPSPADIPSASWYSGAKGPTDLVSNWLAAWADLLSKTLLMEDSNLVINPVDTTTVALFETMYSHVGGLSPSTSYYLGRDGNNPGEEVLQKVRDRLQNPSQIPPPPPFPAPPAPSIADLVETMEQIASQIGAVTAILSCYDDYTAGQDLEVKIAQTIRPVAFTYPAVLALSLTYEKMLGSGYPLGDLLDDMADLEPDGLPNFVEALAYMNGWETNIFKEDTDDDGVVDPFDNCPTSNNPDQLDNDSDGFGNACDTDDDNDGLEDALEDILMTQENEKDSDGDGWSDGKESMMGLDPDDPSDAIFHHDNVEIGGTFTAQNYSNALAQQPSVFASITSFNSGISAEADLRNKTNSGFEFRVEKDPGNPGPIGTEQVSYLVIDPLPSGWNGGTEDISGDWQEIFFDFPYIPGQKPLVFVTIQTENDPTPFHAEVEEIGSASFSLRIRPNSASVPPGAILERVSWMAFLPGSEIPCGGLSGETVVGASVETVLFDTPFTEPPTVLATAEGQGIHTIVGSVAPIGFQLLLQTDFTDGSPATDQRVSWVALGTTVCEDPDMDGVCSVDDNAPEVYNPDQLDSDGDGFANIIEWLAGSDMFDPNSTPSMNNAQALLDLIEMGATPQELFEFAQMWMTP